VHAGRWVGEWSGRGGVVCVGGRMCGRGGEYVAEYVGEHVERYVRYCDTFF